MRASSFLMPAYLVFALLVVAALWMRWRGRGPALRAAAPAPTAARDPTPALPVSWRTRLRTLPVLLEALGILLALLALARPIVREELPLRSEGLDILLCLDISSSMQAHDMDADRTRLEVARDAAAAFVDGRKEDRIGLVTFARYPDLRSPLTRDHDALKKILADVATVESDSLEDATGIGTAVARAAQVLAESGAASGVVILLTDGEENVALAAAQGEIPPIQAAQLCERLGIRVYPIAAGIGKRNARGAWVALDTQALEDLATRTAGTFHAARDAGAVEEVYATIDALEKAPFEEGRIELRDRYLSFLLAALAFLLVGRLLATTILDVKP